MTSTDFRALRERLQLTQAGAAALFDVDLRTWQNWEAGKGIPGPARRLAQVIEAVPEASRILACTARTSRAS